MSTNTESIIIFGFPGVGKTYAFLHQEELGLDLQDSDSSMFHWILDDSGNPIVDKDGKKIVHPAWPKNYADYISLTGKEQEKKPDYIFVSTHEDASKAIMDLNMVSFTVIPDKDAKDYFVNLYKNRGNDEKFIERISNHWDSFIKSTKERAILGNSNIVIVGPDRKFKNVYDFLKADPMSLFAMQFDL